MQLSIVTVNLNNREGLKKTLQSIFSQSFDDYRVFVIDGGSVDGSIDTLRSMSDQNARLTWISEKDAGVYPAMNKGIRMATGEFILFLNSGDYFVNSEVLKSVFSRSHSDDILVCNCRISVDGRIVHTTSHPEQFTFGYLYQAGLPHQSTFIRRSLFERVGMYREDFRFNSDLEFWYRVLLSNQGTFTMLPVAVSDYDAQGMSGQNRNTDEYKREMDEIHSHPALRYFISDYDAITRERARMAPYEWAKNHLLLRWPIEFLYKSACFVVTKFKK